MGSICTWCNEDMSKVSTCRGNDFVEIDGVKWPSIPYINSFVFPPGEHGASSVIVGELSDRCHDCNVQLAAKHHPGCDMERCPKCGGQLISCGCLAQ